MAETAHAAAVTSHKGNATAHAAATVVNTAVIAGHKRTATDRAHSFQLTATVHKNVESIFLERSHARRVHTDC